MKGTVHILALFIILASSVAVFCQKPQVHQRTGVWKADNQLQIEVREVLDRDQPFVACVIKLKEQWPESIWYSVRSGDEWSDPAELLKDAHVDGFQSNMIFLPASTSDIRVFTDSGLLENKELTAYFIYPGHSTNGSPISFRNDNYCDQPVMAMRGDWCPNGNCPEDATPEFTDATHLIVHHSAGTNVSSDWSAVVRSIWGLHVNVNGWDDIGYNWLVDPEGNLYEGRGQDRLGAHFCHQNSNTAGICVLGNFQNFEPSDSALVRLGRLLTWVCFENDIDPLGFSIHSSSGLDLAHISGHRDGCSTVCPGEMLYPRLTRVRSDVNSSLAFCDVTGIPLTKSSNLLSIFPNPAHDILQFDSNGEANLNTIRIYNSSGNLEEEHFRWPSSSIPVSHLERGMYYLVVNDQIRSFIKM